MIQGKQLLLASGSPRRRELLSALDTDMRVVKLMDISENYPPDLCAENVAEYLACKKIEAYDASLLQDNDILITADTVVILNGKVLGKPKNENEARTTLKEMSGKTHIVTTGVALKSKDKSISFTTTTKVTFDNLTDEQIDYYIKKYAPMDKAGAYGIQEWIGYIGISKIEGCYYNVMGLPLHDLYHNIIDSFS